MKMKLRKQKQKLTALLMALCMVLTLVPVGSAMAADADGHGDHVSGGYTALDSSMSGQTLTGGSYYLTENITNIETSIEITGTVDLCLNGHTVSGDASNGIFRIGAGGVLNVYDCTGNGKITEIGSHNPVFIHSGGMLNLYGGTIESTITAVVIDEDPSSGGNNSTGGTVNVYGGTVVSTGSDSQAIKVNAGMTAAAVNISGGTVISPNKIISAESGTIQVSGGQIAGNLPVQMPVYLSGDASIGTGETGITVAENQKFYLSGALTSASVYVIPQAELADGTVIAEASDTYTITESDVEALHLDGSYAGNKELYLENNQVKICEAQEPGPTETYLDYNEETGEFEEKTQDNVTVITSDMTTLEAGWYVVDGTVEIPSCITVSGDVHLILKDGCMLNAAQGINVSDTNSLTIYGQSGGTGTLNATGQKGGYPGIGATRGEVGTIVINGGVITATGTFANDVVGTSGGISHIGAGIGGASGNDGSYTTGGTVVITGGQVTANGGLGFSSGYNRSAPGIQAESFSTGASGNAVIKTNYGISDKSKQDAWSGIIYEGSSGEVYGDQTLTADLEIESGHTLTVSSGANLTVPDGVTLTNQGTLELAGGDMECAGSLTNSGALNVGTESNLSVTGALNNSGAVTVEGTASCGSIQNSGTINISGSFTCNGGTNTGLIHNTGTLTNTGTISGENGHIVSTSPIQGAEDQLLSSDTLFYMDENGEKKYLSPDDAIYPLTAADHTWKKQDGKNTWYVVTSDLTINDGAKLEDDVNLLLMDGVTLTVNGINGNGGINAMNHTLNIYAQSCGDSMGKLIATGGYYNWMAIGGENAVVNIYGGFIEAGLTGSAYTGIGNCQYRTAGKITISGGLIKTKSIGYGNVGGSTEGLFAPEGSGAVIYTQQTQVESSKVSGFNGILFLQKNGSVYGDAELAMNLTVGSDEILTIPEGTTLTIPAGMTLTIEGKLTVEGTLENNGTIVNNSEIANSGAIHTNEGGSFAGTEPSGTQLSYQINWDTNGDGVVDDITYALSGTVPTHEDGSKEPAVDIVYTFAGWSPELQAASEPATYKAWFYVSARTYTVTLPENPVGYAVSTEDGTSVNYQDTFTFQVELAEGYSATDSFAVKANGAALTAGADGVYRVTIEEDTAITVEGVADITAPEGDIKIGENSVKKFIDQVTFGLFFKETVDVTITGTDSGSGVQSIEYYRSEEVLSEEQVAAFSEWTEYTGAISETAKDAERFIYYVKITDKDGNATCFASSGATFDLTPPSIAGVTDGATYYTTQKVAVTDANLDAITVNGERVTLDENNAFTLAGNAEAKYVITAADRAGNTASVTIMMQTIASLADGIGGLTEENVTSADEEAVTAVKTATGNVDTENASEAEKAALQTITGKCDALLEQIEKIEQELSDVASDVNGFDVDSIKSSDKETVEALIEEIDALLASGNLTEEEKQELEDARGTAEALIEKIEATAVAGETENIQNVQTVTPDNVKPEDKQDLEAAKEDIEQALNDYADNYTEEEKAELEEALSRIEEALEVVERAEEAGAAIEALPDTVSPDDTEAEAQISAAKERYDALSEYEKSLIPAEMKEKLENLLADLGDYRIIEGSGATWAQESPVGLSFTANGAYSKFTGIEVDGKAVDADCYTAVSGSTIITLKTAYLKTLAAGEHTLTVLYTDGEASGTFTIAEKPAEVVDDDGNTPQTGDNGDETGNDNKTSPETGDDSNIALWIAVLLAAGAALTGTILYSRKRKYSK